MTMIPFFVLTAVLSSAAGWFAHAVFAERRGTTMTPEKWQQMKDLRALTGVSLDLCLEALRANGFDSDRSARWLRRRGDALADVQPTVPPVVTQMADAIKHAAGVKEIKKFAPPTPERQRLIEELLSPTTVEIPPASVNIASKLDAQTWDRITEDVLKPLVKADSSDDSTVLAVQIEAHSILADMSQSSTPSSEPAPSVPAPFTVFVDESVLVSSQVVAEAQRLVDSEVPPQVQLLDVSPVEPAVTQPVRRSSLLRRSYKPEVKS